MTVRTLLPDCCEDWILEYGGFYQEGEGFRCLECRSAWVKERGERFRRLADGRVFRERRRRRGQAEFRDLVSEEGPNPLLERCCAQILVRHGAHLGVEAFACPVCKTSWRREVRLRGGLEVTVFCRGEDGEAFVLQEGRSRSFLVPFGDYVPPGK